MTTQNTETNDIPEVHALIALSHAALAIVGELRGISGESPQLVTSKEGMIGPNDPEFEVWSDWLRNRRSEDGCAARLKLIQDSGSLLRVLFWRYLPIGEQLIDSRKSLLHGVLWLGQTFDLCTRAELLPEPLYSRCYVVNVSGR